MKNNLIIDQYVYELLLLNEYHYFANLLEKRYNFKPTLLILKNIDSSNLRYIIYKNYVETGKYHTEISDYKNIYVNSPKYTYILPMKQIIEETNIVFNGTNTNKSNEKIKKQNIQIVKKKKVIRKKKVISSDDSDDSCDSKGNKIKKTKKPVKKNSKSPKKRLSDSEDNDSNNSDSDDSTDSRKSVDKGQLVGVKKLKVKPRVNK